MNFITGASGLLGTHLALQLLRQGKQVKALRRANSDLGHMEKILKFYEPEKDYFGSIEWVEGDILDVHSLLDAMKGCDHVYHTAAIVSYHKSDRKMMYKVNVEGTANVVNCALESGISKMCHVSSVAAIGKSKAGQTITEETEWENSDANTHYGITKHESELEVYRGIEEGLKSIIVNPGFIIGPGDFERSSASLFTKLNEGMSFYPPGGTGFISAEDCSNAIVQLMSTDVTNSNYILVSENLSMNEIFCEVSKSLGKKIPTREATKNIMLIARIGEWIKEIITGKKALVTKETVKNASLRVYYDNLKLKNTILFQPQKISDAIELTATYFRTVH